MRSMNLVQMTQLMEKFEQQVGDLDVQTSVMDEAMSATSTLTTPANEVDDLMSQVADEHGLEMGEEMTSQRVATGAPVVGSTTQANAEQVGPAGLARALAVRCTHTKPSGAHSHLHATVAPCANAAAKIVIAPTHGPSDPLLLSFLSFWVPCCRMTWLSGWLACGVQRNEPAGIRERHNSSAKEARRGTTASKEAAQSHQPHHHRPGGNPVATSIKERCHCNDHCDTTTDVTAAPGCWVLGPPWHTVASPSGGAR